MNSSFCIWKHREIERERGGGEEKRDREEEAGERENIRFREGEILLVFSSGPKARDNAQKICTGGK